MALSPRVRYARLFAQTVILGGMASSLIAVSAFALRRFGWMADGDLSTRFVVSAIVLGPGVIVGAMLFVAALSEVSQERHRAKEAVVEAEAARAEKIAAGLEPGRLSVPAAEPQEGTLSDPPSSFPSRKVKT